MIPQIIHQTARTSNISWEERQLVKRMRRIMPDWEYMFHDDDDNAKLIKTHFPQYYSVYNAIPKGVAKADIARLVYMYVYGGFYFDTDFKLIKPVPEWMLEKEQLIMVSREEPLKYGNAILASSPRGCFFKGYIEHIFESDKLKHLEENHVEVTTGPEALTAFYLANEDKYRDSVTIVPRTYFNPPVMKRGLDIQTTEESVGVHLCWGSWRSGSLIKRVYIFIKRKLQAII